MDHADPLQARRARRRARRSRAGFALVETMVGAALLAIALSGMLMVIVSFGALGTVNRESQTAQQAAREVLEQIGGTPFQQVFASYDADPANDPGGPGTSPGAGFAVRGLGLRPGDPDGLAGRIEFPTVAGALREDANDPGLGLPRDLNSDNIFDGLDHSADYVLLPLRVRIEWRGKAGDRALVIEHLLTAR